MRRIFILLICLFLLSSPLLSPPASADNGNTTVYVTQTGYAYHRSGCYHLKSRIPMTLREAVRSGYSPCKDCKPPRPDFKVDVATATPRSGYASGSVSSRFSGSSWFESALHSVQGFFSSLPTVLVLVISFLAIPLPWLALCGVFWLVIAIIRLIFRFLDWLRSLFRRNRR